MFTGIDALTVTVSYIAAIGLRGLDEPSVVLDYRTGFFVLLPLIVAAHLVTNFLFGVYGHEWEHASIEEAMRLIVASVTAGVGTVIALLSIQEVSGAALRLIPIGVVVLGSVFSLGSMGAVRFRARMFSFRRVLGMVDSASTIVLGTGDDAVELARKGIRGQQPMRMLGFISSRPGYTHKRIADLPVLGSLEDIPTIVKELQIEQVLIAEPLESVEMRNLIDRLVDVDVRLRIIPRLDEVLGPEGRLQDVRDVSVADLLPRPSVATDLSRVSQMIAGRRVLITGAGGSIGSELTRQILRFAPDAVFALDHDETHLYDGAFTWQEHELAPTTLLCDIRDAARLEQIFSETQPDIVFHAAANKHVPILERFPEEAVKTNVFGTLNVLEACNTHGVEEFVLISTDKAVEPSSVMGASKRVAEMLTQSSSEHFGDRCTHTAVRFGNVLGSRGSVVPTFQKQIQAGGPVTVTDPDMLRYFMTVDEAVQLVLQASSLATGGDVYVLDMGEPVRIGDLARRMIRLAGLVPGRDIEVNVTGARPGEKQAEILSVNPLVASPLAKVKVARPGHPGRVTLLEMVNHLGRLSEDGMRSELCGFILDIARIEWLSEEIVNIDSNPQLPVFEAVPQEADRMA